jgi:hypothetical protein
MSKGGLAVDSRNRTIVAITRLDCSWYAVIRDLALGSFSTSASVDSILKHYCPSMYTYIQDTKAACDVPDQTQALSYSLSHSLNRRTVINKYPSTLEIVSILNPTAQCRFFPSLSIASISSLKSLISPAATYPLIRDSVWEVVIGTTLLISQSLSFPPSKAGRRYKNSPLCL